MFRSYLEMPSVYNTPCNALASPSISPWSFVYRRFIDEIMTDKIDICNVTKLSEFIWWCYLPSKIVDMQGHTVPRLLEEVQGYNAIQNRSSNRMNNWMDPGLKKIFFYIFTQRRGSNWKLDWLLLDWYVIYLSAGNMVFKRKSLAGIMFVRLAHHHSEQKNGRIETKPWSFTGFWWNQCSQGPSWRIVCEHWNEYVDMHWGLHIWW